MEDYKINFIEISKILDKINKDFIQEIELKDTQLKYLKFELSKNIKLLKDNTSKIDSFNDRTENLKREIIILEDEVSKKKDINIKFVEKQNEIDSLILQKEKLLLDINLNKDIKDKQVAELFMSTKKLQQIQNNLTRMDVDKKNLLIEIDKIEKILDSKNKEFVQFNSDISQINLDISNKENMLNSIVCSISSNKSKLEILEDTIKQLETKKLDLNIYIKENNKTLDIGLKDLKDIKESSLIEKNKLKQEEDRLISLRKEIQQTILNNREMIDSNKLADFVKAVENDNKNS